MRLVPLTINHADAIFEAGNDEAVWSFTLTRIRSITDMRTYVKEALAEQNAGTALPFATTLRDSGQVIGSTRFGNWAPAHKRVEIGWKWISPAWQRTAVNTEAKRLMLTHAFETLHCRRVELKTSALNTKSQNAMLRIGATKEGTFRNHMINPDGSARDSVYFSIIDRERPTVRDSLLNRLSRPEKS